MKKLSGALIFLFLTLLLASAENTGNLTVNAAPQGLLPLGSSVDYFTFGTGGEVSASYIPEGWKLFGFKAGVEFLSLPLNSPAEDHSVWSVSGFGGPFVRIPFNERLSLFIDGRAGYYYWGPGAWDAGEENGGGFVTGGSAGVLFRITGPFTLGAGICYDYYTNLYNGINISMSASLDLPALEKGKGALELKEIKLFPLFPVLYGYYSNHTVGTVRVMNAGTKPAENITLQFFVEKYMDNPMKIGSVFSLAPGEEKVIELVALFNENLMEITEGTKISAQIAASYRSKKDDYIEDASGILEFYNRNAMMWDEDIKIASFMTAKDPEVMNFAKNAVSWMQSVKNPALDDNLQKAIALFEAVKAYGIRYEIDPATPFSEFSEDTRAVDYLQFPRQTLQYTNGDCDDLTTLYTSLLEAVGVETAFITIPGHIYAAFSLNTPVSEVEKIFSNQADIIYRNNRAWIPVEITLFQDSFENAWFTGAREWREQNGSGQAALYPVRDAWNTYKAVGFREGAGGIILPDRSSVTEAVAATINKHVEREIFPQEDSLKKKLRQNPEDIRTKNKLALIYARYGLYEQALNEFMAVLEQQEYLPSLTNTGNIYYLKHELTQALEFYNRALKMNENNRSALIGVARCNYEMENYGMVKQLYAKISEIDPELAERFIYLNQKTDDSARASTVEDMKNIVVWEDEE